MAVAVRWLTIALLVAAAPPPGAGAQESPHGVRPGQPVQITGEVVELSCYLRDGSRGEAHKPCALSCLKNGGQLGIVEDGSGTLYPLAGAKPATEPSEGVRELIAARIAVRGRLYEKAGSRVLVPETIEPLQAERTTVR